MADKYDYDKAKALPVDFDEEPPEDYEGDMDTDIVRESQGALQNSDAAKRAGSMLARMDKNDIDALYAALGPIVKKIRWYISRYDNMQDKIWYLSDENKRLLKRVTKMRSILQEHGIKGDY